MIKEQYKNNDSTILYGVPRVGWGVYDGCTPYAICLKACADYLGDDTEAMIANLANAKLREQICEYISQARALDEKALDALKNL